MSDIQASQVSQKITLNDGIVSSLVANLNLTQDKAEQAFDIIMAYIKDHPHQLLSYLNNLQTGGAAGGTMNFFH